MFPIGLFFPELLPFVRNLGRVGNMGFVLWTFRISSKVTQLSTGMAGFVWLRKLSLPFLLEFVQILHEAGLPIEYGQALVTDTNKTATKLVTDERVGFFSFIGSAAAVAASSMMPKVPLAAPAARTPRHPGLAQTRRLS